MPTLTTKQVDATLRSLLKTHPWIGGKARSSGGTLRNLNASPHEPLEAASQGGQAAILATLVQQALVQAQVPATLEQEIWHAISAEVQDGQTVGIAGFLEEVLFTRVRWTDPDTGHLHTWSKVPSGPGLQLDTPGAVEPSWALTALAKRRLDALRYFPERADAGGPPPESFVLLCRTPLRQAQPASLTTEEQQQVAVLAQGFPEPSAPARAAKTRAVVPPPAGLPVAALPEAIHGMTQQAWLGALHALGQDAFDQLRQTGPDRSILTCVHQINSVEFPALENRWLEAAWLGARGEHGLLVATSTAMRQRLRKLWLDQAIGPIVASSAPRMRL